MGFEVSLSWHSRHALSPLALAAAAFCVGSAHAQEAPDLAVADPQAATPTAPAAAASTGSERTVGQADQLSTVFVTANRRRELAKDVAGSVSVLGGAQLEKLQAQSLQDFAAFVPGLQVVGERPGQQQQSIRGLTVGSGQVSATVATYLDETPISFNSNFGLGGSYSPDVDALDLERIEVLKGPQGSLYGASALGGVIKYVTVAPNLKEVEGRAEVGFDHTQGGGGGWLTRFAVNAPVVPGQFGLRVTGWSRKSAGFVDDAVRGQSDVDSNRNEGLRLSGLLQASSTLSVRLTAERQRMKTDDTSVPLVDPQTLAPAAGKLESGYDFAQPLDVKSDRAALTINYDMGFATLLSVSSWLKTKTDRLYDYSPLAAAFYGSTGATAGTSSINVNNQKATQEFRLISPAGGTVDWIAGLFYTREKTFWTGGLDLFSGALPFKSLLPGFTTSTQGGDLTDASAYANATVKLGSSVDLQGGVRFARVKQTLDQQTSFAGVPAPSSLTSVSQDATTWTLSPRWKLSTDHMVYARVATGYRPGGPNVPAPNGTIFAPFKSDSIVNYEVGYKGALPDARFDLNVSLFRVNWKDIQLTAIDAASASGYYTNGGKAHSQGLELEAGWRPFPQLRLAANATLMQAKLDQDVPEVSGKSGDDIPYSPKLAAALQGTWSTQVGDGLLNLTAAGRWSGKREVAFTNQVITPFAPAVQKPQLPSYALLDLLGSYSFDRWTIGAYVKNVTNKVVPISYTGTYVLPNGTGGYTPAQAGVNKPRTIGATVRFDY